MDTIDIETHSTQAQEIHDFYHTMTPSQPPTTAVIVGKHHVIHFSGLILILSIVL
jgi:alkyl sulfatase BDS1-like metallo-beta-lactamase superfamily hydrolase